LIHDNTSIYIYRYMVDNISSDAGLSSTANILLLLLLFWPVNTS
jgi:hypothetical protein